MLLTTIKNHQLIYSQINGYLHLMDVSKDSFLIFVANCTRTESSWVPISMLKQLVPILWRSQLHQTFNRTFPINCPGASLPFRCYACSFDLEYNNTPYKKALIRRQYKDLDLPPSFVNGDCMVDCMVSLSSDQVLFDDSNWDIDREKKRC